MARKIEVPRADDWAEGDTEDSLNGPVTKWFNVVTGEQAMLKQGKHPHSNPNAAHMPATLSVVNGSPPMDESTDDDEDGDDPASRVLALMRKGAGEGRADVHVYRIESSGSPAFCDKISASDFADGNYSMIRDQFGPGKYRLTLYATNPATGKYARRGSEEVTILAPATASLNKAVGSDPVQQQILDTLKLLAERQNASQVPQKSTHEAMMEQLVMMKAMREAFAPPPVPTVDPMDAITKLMDAMGKARELRDMIDPPPEPADPMMAMFPKVLETIAAMQSKQPAPQPQQFAQIPQIQQPQPEPELEQVKIMQKLAFDWMAGQIASKAPADDVAATIYEHAPDDVLDAILSEQWRDMLYTARPDFQQHDAYLQKIRGEVVRLDNEPDEPADLPTDPQKKSA